MISKIRKRKKSREERQIVRRNLNKNSLKSGNTEKKEKFFFLRFVRIRNFRRR
jgi:hypothetical protein